MVEQTSFNSIEDFERQVRGAVDRREDLRIKTNKNRVDVIKTIRKVLEEAGLRYRVYTRFRGQRGARAMLRRG